MQTSGIAGRSRDNRAAQLPPYPRANHRHVGRQIHSGRQRLGPPRNRLPIRKPGNSRVRGRYLPPMLTALGTIPGTTLRFPSTIPSMAASATGGPVAHTHGGERLLDAAGQITQIH